MSQVNDPNPIMIAITADSYAVMADVENTEICLVRDILSYGNRSLDSHI
jgi:hypothetical protein